MTSFLKMHGLGNDFVIFDARIFPLPVDQVTAKVVADMLTTVGVNRVMTMDLHADQIQGFFNIPVDNIYATPVLLGDLWKQNYDNLLVVSPDVGGVVRARPVRRPVVVSSRIGTFL